MLRNERRKSNKMEYIKSLDGKPINEQEIQEAEMTLAEFAKIYEPPKTKNIADLDEVSVKAPRHIKEGLDKEGKPFKYVVITVDGQEYRVPGCVVWTLRAILEKKPSLKKFCVSKTGTGMATKYTVIPLE